MHGALQSILKIGKVDDCRTRCRGCGGAGTCYPIDDEYAMTQDLHHAVYSATLNTEASATFMFLLVWGEHATTNPSQGLALQ
eukprot:1161723-Pelagomonas_calceolata.AAC.5